MFVRYEYQLRGPLIRVTGIYTTGNVPGLCLEYASPFCNTLIVRRRIDASSRDGKHKPDRPSPNAANTVAVESELVFTVLRTMGAKHTKYTSARNLVTRHSSAEKTELLYHYRDFMRVMRLICVLCVCTHKYIYYYFIRICRLLLSLGVLKSCQKSLTVRLLIAHTSCI